MAKTTLIFFYMCNLTLYKNVRKKKNIFYDNLKCKRKCLLLSYSFKHGTNHSMKSLQLIFYIVLL